MRRIIYWCLFIFFLPTCSIGQDFAWESFAFSEVNHPFVSNKYSPHSVSDSKGNLWTLTNNTLHRYGTDTSIYQNFPIPSSESPVNYHLTKGPDDHLCFYHRSFGSTVFDNYLGYFNGSELRFFSESDMGIGVTGKLFSELCHTSNYIWFNQSGRIVRFDKLNFTFSAYPYSGVTFISDDSSHVFLKDQGAVSLFNEDSNSWDLLIPNDSITTYLAGADNGDFYFAGNGVYKYSAQGLVSYDSIPNKALLGNVRQVTSPGNDLVVVTYENGFVIIDGENMQTKFFDATLENTLLPAYSIPSYYQDNGILVLPFKDQGYGDSTYYFFAYEDQNLTYETKYSLDGLSKVFFYKETLGNIFLYISEYDYNINTTWLKVIKNELDTTIIDFPVEVEYVRDIKSDSNYIWILNNTSSIDDPNTVFRLQKKTYLIKGKVFYDTNQNGVQEESEPGVSEYALVIKPSNLLVIPSSSGSFSFAGEPDGEYILQFLDSTIFSFTSVSLPYTLQNSEINNLGVNLIELKPSVNTNFHLAWPRCDTEKSSYFRVVNTGYETIEKFGLSLTSDNEVSLSYYGDFQQVDALNFELINLQPGEEHVVPYTVKWPSAEMTGKSVTFRMASSIYSGGNIVKSETDSIQTIIRCSYDPNDKSATPVGEGEQYFTAIDSPLSYLVRFENTGNDTAYTVIVHDTLDSNLDFSTLCVQGVSHEVQTEISESGIVVFRFENIMLPDSTTNKEKAQGFVRFVISPRKNLPNYTTVKNKAAIVFDSNEPIITNEAINVFVEDVAIALEKYYLTGASMFIYPNPATDNLFIKCQEGSYFKIFNSLGQLVLKTSERDIRIEKFSPGIFLIKGYSENGKKIAEGRVIVTR